MAIQVAIVEDDFHTRTSLKLMIESSPELSCCGVFADAESFTDKFDLLPVDVVLMDINLPGHSGIECVQQLKRIKPHVQFLMCTHLEDTNKIFSALRVGATGYLIKNTTHAKLVAAIKDIYRGGSPMSPQIARKVIEAFATDKANLEQINLLTKREKQIIDLLALGHPYKEIALNLSISIETVRSRIRDIYAKLQVHNRTDAINKLYPKTKG